MSLVVRPPVFRASFTEGALAGLSVGFRWRPTDRLVAALADAIVDWDLTEVVGGVARAVPPTAAALRRLDGALVHALLHEWLSMVVPDPKAATVTEDEPEGFDERDLLSNVVVGMVTAA